MSLSIPQRFITDLDSFTWGDGWRATRIMKEKRVNGEFYFAEIVKYYGVIDETNDYDISDSMAEYAWLGRVEKFVGKRKKDMDEDSPTAGQRIWSEAITEEIEEPDLKGKPSKRTVLVKGKTIYEYNIPVTKENTEKMKSIAGSVGINQETQFLFVYGAKPPNVVEPDTFWGVPVTEYIKSIKPEIKVSHGKKV